MVGLTALVPQPGTSQRRRGHPVYPVYPVYPVCPDLLRDLTISRPNHVWAMDITDIPMARGFVFLAAVMDWASRKVLAWRVSATRDRTCCIEAVEEAITTYGRPEILNTDQGCQCTSAAFTARLTAHGIRISMDGQGCWRDNVFVAEARASLGRYLTRYNTRRSHSSLADQSPAVAFSSHPSLPLPVAA